MSTRKKNPEIKVRKEVLNELKESSECEVTPSQNIKELQEKEGIKQFEMLEISKQMHLQLEDY